MMLRSTPRRFIGRLLLSLALLWAQQAALSHTLSHTLSHALHAASGVGRAPSKSLAADQVCGDCLSYAQFFSALGNQQRPPAMMRPAALRLVMPATPESCRFTTCMFQPRAPPPA